MKDKLIQFKNSKLLNILIVVLFVVGIVLVTYNKKNDTENNVDLINQKSASKEENLKLDDITQSPKKNDFPPSQRSIDGFFLGQHISTVTNTLGESNQIIKEDKETKYYTYQLDNGLHIGTFLAFGIYNPESGLIGAIQLTGEKSDKETFLGLKLGDSKEKVINTLGKPSKIELGTRNSDLYIYDDRNYTVQLSKENKLFSIRIATLRGFAKNAEIGDFIKNFTDTLNTKDINKISEFLMPDMEIYIKDDIFEITKRFSDELFDPNSEIMKYLLFTKNSVKDMLNNYNGEIDMQLRITEKGPSGYVYKFIESKTLEEIFVIEHAGRWRVYEIKYR